MFVGEGGARWLGPAKLTLPRCLLLQGPFKRTYYHVLPGSSNFLPRSVIASLLSPAHPCTHPSMRTLPGRAGDGFYSDHLSVPGFRAL